MADAKSVKDVYRTTLTSIVQYSERPEMVKKAQGYLKGLNDHEGIELLLAEIDDFLAILAGELSHELEFDVVEWSELTTV